MFEINKILPDITRSYCAKVLQLTDNQPAGWINSNLVLVEIRTKILLNGLNEHNTTNSLWIPNKNK